MSAHLPSGKELAKTGGRFVGHAVALVAGLVLIIAGIGMGVSIVLLPIGIPVGFFGLFLLLWGLFGSAAASSVVRFSQSTLHSKSDQGRTT